MKNSQPTAPVDDAKSIYAPPEPPDSPFSPPYRTDSCIEHRLVQLQTLLRMRLEAGVQSLHQEALIKLVRQVHSCPEPVPALVAPECPPCRTDEQRSERIHAVVQLLSQIRENQHQAQLRKVYKMYGSDHRKAAKELYTREHFTIAYIQYWTMFACLSCDKCRKLSSAERHNLTVDLLEKLAVTCLRAGWLADAANFASEALKREERSTRARIWLATAQLGLGNLDVARKNLMMLPRRGQFPPDFPAWIEARVLAQREVLARLEQETRGVFDVKAMELDSADRTPITPHSTAVFHVEATPAGYRTIARVAKDALLLVASPLACAPCYAPHAETSSVEAVDTPPATPKAKTTSSDGQLPLIIHDDDPTSLFSLALVADSVFENAKVHSQDPSPTSGPAQPTALPPPQQLHPPTSAHDEDPSILTLATLADTVYTQAKVLPLVRIPVRAAAARCRKEGEAVIDLVGNELRAAAILVAQNYTVGIPHPSVNASGGKGRQHSWRWTTEAGLPDKPVHAGHAIYLPALKLISSTNPNTYPTFHGPHLFLRAREDLRAGTLLTFGGFSGIESVRPPPISEASRARVTALASAQNGTTGEMTVQAARVVSSPTIPQALRMPSAAVGAPKTVRAASSPLAVPPASVV